QPPEAAPDAEPRLHDVVQQVVWQFGAVGRPGPAQRRAIVTQDVHPVLATPRVGKGDLHHDPRSIPLIVGFLCRTQPCWSFRAERARGRRPGMDRPPGWWTAHPRPRPDRAPGVLLVSR